MKEKTPFSNILSHKKKNLDFFNQRGLGFADSGLSRYYTDDVSAELNSCLQGQAGSIAFKKMSREDSIIGGILRSYENPIMSAGWRIGEVQDGSEVELEIVKVLETWFFKRMNFQTLLGQILGMLPMGFSLFEKFYTMQEIEGKKYMLPILAERVQTSIRRIDYAQEIVEQNATKGGLVEMPFNDLVFFTFRKCGNDRRGTSLLRQAYSDFVSKREIKAAGTKGIIRSMIGLVLGTMPENLDPSSEAAAEFASMIDDLARRDFNGISDSAIKTTGYEIEILNSTFNLEAMKNYIAYLDSSMTMSVLSQFITLGQSGGGGSYSLGRDSSDMLLDGLGYIIDLIEQTFSQEVIHPLVAMNWAGVDATKFTLSANNLDKKNSKEFAETIKVLIDSGIIKVQQDDEAKIRKMYDLPEINEEEREEAEDELVQQAESEKDDEEEQPAVEEEKDENNSQEENEEKEEEIIKLSENWTNAKERRKFKEQEAEKLNKFTRASLQLIADEFSKAVRRQLNKGTIEAQGLKDLKINNIGAYKKRLGQKIAGVVNQSWKNAVKNARSKIKLSEIAPSELADKVLTAFVLNLADSTAENQISDLRNKAILTANTALTKGLPVNNAMALVDKSMDEYIDAKNKIDVGNELAVVQAMNFGERQYYKTIENDLWGYRFANDVPETDLCRSLVGKTYPLNSAELDLITPPLHFRCDSFLVPIYKKEEAKPEFDNFVPAPEIMKEKNI